MMTFQEVVEAINNFSTEERERLFELIRQQKIEEKTAKQEKFLGFWDMTLEFRKRIERENIVFNEEDFANLRDRSAGREVIFE